MSAEAVGWVLDHSPAVRSARLVHLAIAEKLPAPNYQHGDATEVWVAPEQLARATRLPKHVVGEALDVLTAAGLLEYLDAGRVDGPVKYRFVFLDAAEDLPDVGVPAGSSA